MNIIIFCPYAPVINYLLRLRIHPELALNGSLTPSRFKAVLIWTGRSVRFDTQQNRLFLRNSNKYPSRVHLFPRTFTRARFESAPLTPTQNVVLHFLSRVCLLAGSVTAIQSTRDIK
jgi:hypothetical protein